MNAPQGPQWEAGATGITECDIASVVNGADGVVLSFGRCVQAEDGQQVRRLHQVQLSPAAAASLRQMLARLVAQHPKDGGR